MIEFSRICQKQNSIFENFKNLFDFFLNSRIFLFLCYNVHKKKMFTIEKEDGREAP